jgi:hypothetical protein
MKRGSLASSLLLILLAFPVCLHGQLGLDTTKWIAANQVWIANNGDLDCQLPAQVAVPQQNLLTLTLYYSAAGIACTGGVNYGPSVQHYIGGSIWARSFSFTTGAIEARINYSGGTVHSTFWLMGEGCLATMYQYLTWCNALWPTPNSEVDIAEVQPGGGFNIAFHAGTPDIYQPISSVTAVNTWHTYRFERTSTSMVWKVDGTVVYTLTSGLPPGTLAYYPIISQEIAPGTSQTTGYPVTTQVEYVRVWSSPTGESLTDASLIFDDEFAGGQGVTAASLRAAQVKQ